jgi:hypothetical protein
VRIAVPLCAVVALLAAGCGARSSTPFTAKGTAPCLKTKGFTGVSTNPAKVGFIAGFAANGGIRAVSPNQNVVTIAFAADPDGVASTERAFRLHAPPTLRPHITDVMSSNRNAVVVWTTSPVAEDSSAVNGCLAS